MIGQLETTFYKSWKLIKDLKSSIIEIGSNYRFLFALSLVVSIIISMLLVVCNNVNAQTIEYLHRKVGPQIEVGNRPMDIQINKDTNQVYVANYDSNSVFVIDSNSGHTKNIRVGVKPSYR
jgi:YVTN family beta-propeller protein